MKLNILICYGAVLLTSVTSLAFRAEQEMSIPRKLSAMEHMANMLSFPPAGACLIENGFDYVGNDLRNYPGSQASDCCQMCGGVIGCVAFSWTNYNGGTCWLKSARDVVIASPNVKSALMTYDENEYQCKASDVGIDYIGNDIGSEKAATAAECCGKCRAKAGCRAFSHNNYNGGTCWLKSKKGATRSDVHVTSGEAYPPTQPVHCPNILADTDFIGYDMTVIPPQPAAKPELCCALCRAFSVYGCRHFSWSNYNGGTCWLKYQKGTAVRKLGVYSATVSEDPFPVACELDANDVDYVGWDIGNAPSKDAQGCCAICFQFARCQAFTWSSYNGGTCWLKERKENTVIKPGVKSGTVGRFW